MQKKVYEVIESGYEPGKVIFKGEIYNPYTPDLDDPCKIIYDPSTGNIHLFPENLDKAKYLYSFLFKNKYPRYQINLKLSQIDFVQISYYRYSFYPSKYLVNGSGNKIVFKFNMLDGSQYIIENLVSSDKETFSKGIELMKKNGVRFVDSYHLLDIICSNKNLDQYIVAIEKEKKHD